jgi:glycolate oxidase FAD binding subunit
VGLRSPVTDDVVLEHGHAVADLCNVIAAAESVAPLGAGTQWEVGGPPPTGVRVTPPAGVLAYDPHELTVTVGAGTAAGELAATLGAAGQECPLDPRDARATVGGILATGLSGHRRLRSGPLRDQVLEVHFVTADGRRVKGGGKTVKNVSGYDLPRLLVGSLGTIGVLTQVTLRCRPAAPTACWFVSDADPASVRAALFRPSAVLWDGASVRVLLEGHPDDVEAERVAAGLQPDPTADPATDSGGAGRPEWPAGAHRGRISVRPGAVGELATDLRRIAELRWLAEVGVGTIHVASDDPAALAAARSAAEAAAGWLLREAGAPGLDGFGGSLPNTPLMARIKAAFDPTGKLAPGRLPLPSGAEAEAGQP